MSNTSSIMFPESSSAVSEIVKLHDEKLQDSIDLAAEAEIFASHSPISPESYIDPKNNHRWGFTYDYFDETTEGSNAIKMYEESDTRRGFVQLYKHLPQSCLSHMGLVFDRNGKLIKITEVDVLKMRADEFNNGVFQVVYEQDYRIVHDLTKSPLIANETRRLLRRYIDSYKKLVTQESLTDKGLRR